MGRPFLPVALGFTVALMEMDFIYRLSACFFFMWVQRAAQEPYALPQPQVQRKSFVIYSFLRRWIFCIYNKFTNEHHFCFKSADLQALISPFCCWRYSPRMSMSNSLFRPNRFMQFDYVGCLRGDEFLESFPWLGVCFKPVEPCWTYRVKLNGVVILPFQSQLISPPFLLTTVSMMFWKPVPNPEYLSLLPWSFAGKTDQALYLSSLPSYSPRSLVQEIHFQVLAAISPSLSPSSSAKRV